MRLTFIELPAFTRALEEKRLGDDWLHAVQRSLLLDRGRVSRPKALGGFHKMRAPNPARGKGTRGGLRVYFIEFPDLSKVVLALISDKEVEDNISVEDQKALRRMAGELRKELEHE